MIKTELLAANVLRITVPPKLQTEDFRLLAPMYKYITEKYGTLSMFLDATAFEGWENMEAFEHHVKFLIAHHHEVDRVAILAGPEWQHWLIGIVRAFLHPQIQIYDKEHEDDGVRWVLDMALPPVQPYI